MKMDWNKQTDFQDIITIAPYLEPNNHYNTLQSSYIHFIGSAP